MKYILKLTLIVFGFTFGYLFCLNSDNKEFNKSRKLEQIKTDSILSENAFKMDLLEGENTLLINKNSELEILVDDLRSSLKLKGVNVKFLRDVKFDTSFFSK